MAVQCSMCAPLMGSALLCRCFGCQVNQQLFLTERSESRDQSALASEKDFWPHRSTAPSGGFCRRRCSMRCLHTGHHANPCVFDAYPRVLRGASPADRASHLATLTRCSVSEISRIEACPVKST